MKIIMSVVLMLVSFQAIFSQPAKKEISFYSFLDTIIKPDYFSVEIVVAEYVKYEGNGKKSKAVLVPLDTVSQNLISELNRLGFKEPLKKKSIGEKKSSIYGDRVYFDNRPLFQVAYQFDITSRDTINYLFKQVNKENLVSLVVTPQSYDITLAKVKEKLFTRGLNSSKDYAEKIAESNGIKIISQSNWDLNFSPKGTNFRTSHHVDSQPRDFVIDLSDIEIEYRTFYKYAYEDK